MVMRACVPLFLAAAAALLSLSTHVEAVYTSPTGTTTVLGTVCANHFQNIGPFHVKQEDPNINTLDNPEDIGAAHEFWLPAGSSGVAYIGGVNGGVWKTNDFRSTATFGGPHWVPTSDYMPCLNIGALMGSSDDANFVVAGCGYPSNSNNRGGEASGVMITGDGATTWTMSAFPKGYAVSSIQVSGTFSGSHRIVVSARAYKVIRSTSTGEVQNPYGVPVSNNPIPTRNGGIWVSTNQGATWTDVYSANAVTKLLRHPNVPTTLYALGMLGSTSMTANLLVSTNEGSTWSAMPTMPGVASACACQTCGISNGITNVVGSLNYVGGTTTLFVGFFVNSQCYALYRSSSATLGSSWTTITNVPAQDGPVSLGGQGDTNFAMLAHPTLANFLFIGATDRVVFRVNVNTNAWTLIASPALEASTRPAGYPYTAIYQPANTGTAPHADSRNMYWDYQTNELLVTNDGGIYKRTEPANTASGTGVWSTRAGDLAITEGYQVGYDSRSGALVLSAQDNSVMISQFAGTVEATSGIWGYALTGDGSSAVMDGRFNPARMYSANQFLAGWFSMPVAGGFSAIVTFEMTTPALTGANQCGFGGDSDCWNFLNSQALNSEAAGQVLVCTIKDGQCYVAVHPLLPGGTGGSFTRLEFNPVSISGGVTNGIVNSPLIQYVFGGRRNGVSYPSVVFAVSVYYVWARQVAASDMNGVAVDDYSNVNTVPSNLNNYCNTLTPFYNFLYNAFLVQHPTDFYLNIVIGDAGDIWLTTNFGKTFTLLNSPAASNLLAVTGHTSVDTFGTGAAIWIQSWVNGVLPLVISTSYGMWVSFTPLYSNAAVPFLSFQRFAAGSPHTMATSFAYSYDNDVLVASMFGRGVWALQGVTQTLEDTFNGVAGTTTRNPGCVALGLYPNVNGAFGFGSATSSSAAMTGTPGAGRAPFNYTLFNTMGSGEGALGSVSDEGTPDPGTTTGPAQNWGVLTVTVQFSLNRGVGSLSNPSTTIVSDLLSAFADLSPPVSLANFNYLDVQPDSNSASVSIVTVQFLYDGAANATPEQMISALFAQAGDVDSRLYLGQITQFVIPGSVVQTGGPPCKTCAASFNMHSSIIITLLIVAWRWAQEHM